MNKLTSLFLTALLLAPLAAVHAADWMPPAGQELVRLERALAPMHAQFDAVESMVRVSVFNPGYSTSLKTGTRAHATRDSMDYALGLLDTGKAEYLDRASAILRRVIDLQDGNPSSKTYGIWPWFLEEPLDMMNPPDWNWADFGGTTLLQVARDHRKRLPEDLARAVDAAILHAARAIKKRNVGPSYTNIAIMGTYVTLVMGERYGLADWSWSKIHDRMAPPNCDSPRGWSRWHYASG